MNLSEYKSPLEKKEETRANLVKKFVIRLNKDREFTKRKPLTARYYAVKMAKIPIFDLEKYFRECERSGNFGKMWWGRLKKNK